MEFNSIFQKQKLFLNNFKITTIQNKSFIICNSKTFEEQCDNCLYCIGYNFDDLTIEVKNYLQQQFINLFGIKIYNSQTQQYDQRILDGYKQRQQYLFLRKNAYHILDVYGDGVVDSNHNYMYNFTEKKQKIKEQIDVNLFEAGYDWNDLIQEKQIDYLQQFQNLFDIKGKMELINNQHFLKGYNGKLFGIGYNWNNLREEKQKYYLTQIQNLFETKEPNILIDNQYFLNGYNKKQKIINFICEIMNDKTFEQKCIIPFSYNQKYMTQEQINNNLFVIGYNWISMSDERRDYYLENFRDIILCKTCNSEEFNIYMLNGIHKRRRDNFDEYVKQFSLYDKYKQREINLLSEIKFKKGIFGEKDIYKFIRDLKYDLKKNVRPYYLSLGLYEFYDIFASTFELEMASMQIENSSQISRLINK